MTKLETNALRIIGLLYPDIDINGIEKYKEFFSSYGGLMPIVFECNADDPISQCEIRISQIIRLRRRFNWLDGENFDFVFDTEPEFIHAIQLAVIKYLELKNAR